MPNVPPDERDPDGDFPAFADWDWDELVTPVAPLSREELQRRIDVAKAPRPRRPDFPCVYGRLNLQGQRHELRWGLQQPFRPLDLLFWGQSEKTVIERFRIGNPESEENDQLVGELPVAFALINPYPFQQVLEQLASPPTGDHLIGVRLKQRLPRANDGMSFHTGSVGETLSLTLRGPVAHVLVIGSSV